jgi:hypothetical protein
MNNVRLRTLAGLLLLLTPIAFNTLFTLLSMTFEYPDILREPSGYILRHFEEGGGALVATWYGFMLTAVLLIPVAVLVHKVVGGDATPYMGLAAVFGVVAGVVQFLGLVRWPFLVPYLADTYLDPASSEATKAAAAVTLQAFNRYAGVAVGENLGYLFTALWTALVAHAMLRSPLFKPWLGWVGMVDALGILIGTLEPAGFELAGNIVTFSYILWSLWLIVVGVFLCARSRGLRTLPAKCDRGVEPVAGTLASAAHRRPDRQGLISAQR